MWSQGCQSRGGSCSPRVGLPKNASLAILPSTVSQLLSACRMSRDRFAICEWELNQVSMMGVVRARALFVTNVQYSVDDMTGPPLTVKQWVSEDPEMRISYVPGTYVKVIGSLRDFSGERTLLAMDVRPIGDPNEITSHMLEVMQAHMQLSMKGLDVNMNTTAAILPGRYSGGCQHNVSSSMPPVQQQVLGVIRSHTMNQHHISLDELKTKLANFSMRHIRSALTFLLNEGHIFATFDEHHFKAAEL